MRAATAGAPAIPTVASVEAADTQPCLNSAVAPAAVGLVTGMELSSNSRPTY